MIPTGPIIKKMREKHGFPAKAVYEGIISKANYYRFEKGDSETSSNNFVDMLFRLGIDIAEFGHVYREKFNEIYGLQKIYANFQRVYDNKDYRTIHQYSIMMDEAYNLSKNVDYHHVSMIFSVWADYFEHGEITTSKAYLNELLNYVKGAETWYRYDVELYSAIIGFLDWKDLIETIPYVVQRSAFPRSLTDREEVSQPNLVYAALENTLKDKNFDHFEQLLEILKLTKPTEKELSAFYGLKIFTLVKEYVDGTNEDALERIELLLNFMEQLGTFEIKKRLEANLINLKPMAIKEKQAREESNEVKQATSN